MSRRDETQPASLDLIGFRADAKALMAGMKPGHLRKTERRRIAPRFHVTCRPDPPLRGVRLSRGLGCRKRFEFQACRVRFDKTGETAHIRTVPPGVTQLRHQEDIRDRRRAAEAERAGLVGDESLAGSETIYV